MLKIPRQQVLNRWDALPINLREALFAEQNADILWRACENQHLSEDKIRIVATLSGDVIMGFMHPEDLTAEIKTTLGINPEIAASISREIDRKIFGPIKTDLEKVYAPAVSGAELPPTIEEREEREEEREEEIIDLRAEAKKPEGIKEKKILPEIIPIVLQKIKKEPEGGPKIIHEEKKIPPLIDTRKRSLGGLFGFLKKEEAPHRPPDGGGAGQGDKRKEGNTLPVKIKLETKESFGEMALPQKSEIAKTEIPKPRVVHYSDLRTPLSPFGGVEADKRGIVEVEADKRGLETVHGKEKEIKPPENLPITEPPKIEPAVENDEDVIDLRTFEKIKKQ